MSTQTLTSGGGASSGASTRTSFLPVVATVFALLVFALDSATRINIAVAVLYVAVVLMSASFCGWRGILVVSATCMVLTLISFFVVHGVNYDSTAAGRCIVSLAANAITTFLAVRMRLASEALQRTQEQLTEAQKLARMGSFSLRTGGDMINWSEEAARICGFGSELEVPLQAVMERVHPEDLLHVRATFGPALEGEASFDHVNRLLLPDGSIRHVRSVGHRVIDEDGKPAVMGAIMDITAARLAEDSLAEAQAELAHVTRVATLGELTASIAHEVNQPLAGIVTNGEAALRWMARDVPELDEVKRSIERMISDGRRASEVIKRLRNLSRKGSAQTLAVDINEVIEDALPLVQREISNHRVALELDLAGGLPSIQGDKVQLQQVVINLMVNAVQAMNQRPDGPRELIARSRLAGNEVCVAVQDSGPGIDANNEGRLFSAFFTTKPEGMGMGLSICRSIIDAHGGRIWASRNESLGATFQFALPIRRGDEP
ncbi:Adaptive-response sensory-kinase SasA [Labrys miyagiensis]